MRKVSIVIMLVTLGLGWAGTTQAQGTRVSAFGLNCIPTPGLHTRAILVGKIKLTNRTIRFVATCFDLSSPSLFPEVDALDGEVKSIDLSVVTSLENDNQKKVAENDCQAHSGDGFLNFLCNASDQGGMVGILVSIPPVPPQVSANGAAP
jgi:hypothetical protein